MAKLQARHEVPGRSVRRKNRPVGYGMIGRSESHSISRRPVRRVSVAVFLFETSSLQSSNRCAHLHESDRTLRDGSFGWRCSRHFVPGYDRTVPPGRTILSLSAFVENGWFALKGREMRLRDKSRTYCGAKVRVGN